MKAFKQIRKTLNEDYAAVYDYSSSLPNLGSGSYGVHELGDPENIEVINNFLSNYTRKLYFDKKQAVVELKVNLNKFGLDFDVAGGGEGTYALKMWGGSFGKTTDTPFDEFHKSDNIAEKLGHGLNLEVNFNKVGNGLCKAEVMIVPDSGEEETE